MNISRKRNATATDNDTRTNINIWSLRATTKQLPFLQKDITGCRDHRATRKTTTFPIKQRHNAEGAAGPEMKETNNTSSNRTRTQKTDNGTRLQAHTDAPEGTRTHIHTHTGKIQKQTQGDLSKYQQQRGC